MKKILLLAAALVTLTAIGCRQSDDTFNEEEIQSLKVLKKSQKSNIATDSVSTYGSFSQGLVTDGDPAPPPIK